MFAAIDIYNPPTDFASIHQSDWPKPDDYFLDNNSLFLGKILVDISPYVEGTDTSEWSNHESAKSRN